VTTAQDDESSTTDLTAEFTRSYYIGAAVFMLPLFLVLMYLWVLALAGLMVVSFVTPVDEWSTDWLKPVMETATDASLLSTAAPYFLAVESWLLPTLIGCIVALYVAPFAIERARAETGERLGNVALLVALFAGAWAWLGASPIILGTATGDQFAGGAAGLILAFIAFVIAASFSVFTRTAQERRDVVIARQSRARHRLIRLADSLAPKPEQPILWMIFGVILVPLAVTVWQIALFASAGTSEIESIIATNLLFVASWSWTSVLFAAGTRSRWHALFAGLFVVQIANLALLAWRPIRIASQGEIPPDQIPFVVHLSITYVVWIAALVIMCTPSITRVARAASVRARRARRPVQERLLAWWGYTTVTAIRLANTSITIGQIARTQTQIERLTAATDRQRLRDRRESSTGRFRTRTTLRAGGPSLGSTPRWARAKRERP
jgi:hypothetical protein